MAGAAGSEFGYFEVKEIMIKMNWVGIMLLDGVGFYVYAEVVYMMAAYMTMIGYP